MKVKIKRIDKSIPLPEYKTPGSVCFDIVIREKTVIAPHAVAPLPTNLIIETPQGYMFVILPRSSTPKRKGLLIPHGLGIVDQDYCGPTDEVLFQVLNFTDEPVIVEKGERLAQGCFIPVEKVAFEEVEQIEEKSRGGIGSTG